MTSTPVKQQIEDELAKKKKSKFSLKVAASKKPKVCKRQPQQISDSESDSEEVVSESSESDVYDTDKDDGDSDIWTFKKEDLNEGDFLLVKFTSKISVKYFAGKLIQKDVETDSFEVSYLKRQPTKNQNIQFIFPEKEDTDTVAFEDIVAKLTKPLSVGGTARSAKQYRFDVDLCDYF